MSAPPAQSGIDSDPPAQSRAAVLDIAGASYSYGARQALNAVSLTVGAGEIFVLLGPNGAGKTTLVHAISGRLSLDAGAVAVAGSDPAVRSARRSTLGLVPQQIALYPHMTARENLGVFARLLGVAGNEAATRADAFLTRAGLADRSGSRVSELSGGMRRRLNIGAALMHRPKLLILDEPTVGVDPHAREAIHDLLLELRDEGYGVLLTTHDMDQAALLADRVGIIQEGRLLVSGTVETLLQDTFGTGRDLVVELVEPPGDRARSTLDTFGLKALRGARVWSGVLEGDYAAATPLTDALAEAGAEVQALSVREPTLGSVFFQLVGRELTEAAEGDSA